MSSDKINDGEIILTGLAARVNKLMDDRRMNANKLADLSGVPAPRIYALLAGKQKTMSAENIKKLAKALEVTAGDLIDDQFEVNETLADFDPNKPFRVLKTYDLAAKVSTKESTGADTEAVIVQRNWVTPGHRRLLEGYDSLDEGDRRMAIGIIETMVKESREIVGGGSDLPEESSG